MRWVKLGLLATWLACSSGLSYPSGQDDLAIWKEFVAALKMGTFAVDQVRPLYGVPKETLYKWIMERKEVSDTLATWKEWDTPEVFPADSLVNYVLTLSSGEGQKSGLSISLVREGARWYFGAIEGILIRLDKTPSPPTSDFPDLPAETKAWQREEVYWSQIVYFFTVLAPNRGKESFFSLLKDGAGYFVGARTWVPFLPPQRAFILYLCWEQSRLRENLVVLEKLTDEEAIINLQAHFFFLYKRAGHLRTQIPFEDYRRIFETIWQDRAANAGWNLEIGYKDPECLQIVFHFTKKT
jgi:hypothetical protein